MRPTNWEMAVSANQSAFSSQARRHVGAFRGRAPEITACAPPKENCAPQVRIVPQ